MKMQFKPKVTKIPHHQKFRPQKNPNLIHHQIHLQVSLDQQSFHSLDQQS